ncbi:DUF2125 domain-containing protein [Paracoccus caeni]|uniref:DUF2125 domain-containing protein n=1 Tax=Paracoccus caeni TaxID=657651 RepID=A0A934W1P6_9RHOB|nr:DUF2125 domain-containing protein [Paracoccus caeni]MBK4217593.1 DUF2125 domain-containing protein [Paracoccus caeni]
MLRSLSTSAVALIVGAAPALADITPAQAWENLTKYYKDFGYEVTGTVDDAGSSLTVTDAAFTFQNNPGETSITIPKISFTETGDAKVRMVLDGDMAFSATFEVPNPDAAAGTDSPDQDTATDDAADPTAEDGAAGETADADAATGTDMPTETLEMTGTILMPDNEMLMSGSPEDVLYEYTYPSIKLDMQIPMQEDDVVLPATMEFTDVKGTQRNTGADETHSTFDMVASALKITSAMDLPNQEGKFAVDLTMNGIASKGEGTAPAGEFDFGTQMAEALAAGFNFDGTLSYKDMQGTLNVEQPGTQEAPAKTVNGTFTSGASELAFAMAEEGMGYKGHSVNTNVELNISDVPFPIRYGIQETSADLMLPLTKGEEPQPFKFAYTLGGLTLDDAIWNLFDPQSQLPRDPASLTVDLSGDMLVTMDLFDPALSQPQTDANGFPVAPPVPMEPKTLQVNRVALDAVGAKADVTGELDFGDNPEQPVGKLQGNFEGINGLLDKAVAMGFVPQDQVMGVRMMMAMFAKPVEGETDKLATEIEFREGGSIFANGQQIK